MKTRVIYVGLIVVAVAMLFFWSRQSRELSPEEWQRLGVIRLPVPIQIEDMGLIDVEGKPFEMDRFQENWTLVYFGFTSCPHICPTSMRALARFYQDVQARTDLPIQKKFRGAFISVDPARDTPEVVGKFLETIEPSFMGATGSLDKISKLARLLNIGFEIPKNVKPGSNYMVDHDQLIVVIDPEARCVGYIKPPFERARLLRAFDAISTM